MSVYISAKPFLPTSSTSILSNKAVSDGAVSYYLDHYVRARIARVSYGELVSAVYDATNPEHIKRRSTCKTGADGVSRVPDYFDLILEKVLRFRFIRLRFGDDDAQYAGYTSFRNNGIQIGSLLYFVKNKPLERRSQVICVLLQRIARKSSVARS